MKSTVLITYKDHFSSLGHEFSLNWWENNDIDRLVQVRCNSIANAQELRLFYTDPLIWPYPIFTEAPKLIIHWGLLVHVCQRPASTCDPLPFVWHQAITWTNVGLLSIRTNFNEILIKFQNISFKKMHLKVLIVRCRVFCSRLNMIIKTRSLYRIRLWCCLQRRQRKYTYMLGSNTYFLANNTNKIINYFMTIFSDNFQSTQINSQVTNVTCELITQVCLYQKCQ